MQPVTAHIKRPFLLVCTYYQLPNLHNLYMHVELDGNIIIPAVDIQKPMFDNDPEIFISFWEQIKHDLIQQFYSNLSRELFHFNNSFFAKYCIYKEVFSANSLIFQVKLFYNYL